MRGVDDGEEEEEEDEADEFEREGRGVVCVPAERWKNRAPSEVDDSVSFPSSSSSSPFSKRAESFPSGTFDTTPSSLPFRATMLVSALSHSECRAVVSVESMGSRI